MDLQVPLNRLKFGQEDGAGINARVAGRMDGIDALAANLFARGQIENLIVKRFDDHYYAVSNGNRRLAAFRLMHGEDSDHPINCTLRDVGEAEAFEDSLTTAVTARQLHPVDQYEAFARLFEGGKTHEEIARQYGMAEKEVRQALALGHLSPKIRNAWRAGEIKAEVAQAFTLALDHKTQDKAFNKLVKAGHLQAYVVRREFGASDHEAAALLAFAGAEYRAAGGAAVEDLFGDSHVVSDTALLKRVAAEKLQAACDALVADGWSWAAIESDLPQSAKYSWRELEPKELVYEGDEEARLAGLREAIKKNEAQQENGDFSDGLDEQLGELQRDEDTIMDAVHRRSFTTKQKAKSGCIVAIEFGRLSISFGVIKPEEVSSASKRKAADGDAVADTPPEPAVSQALLHRLSLQLTEAAATALSQDLELAIIVLLAGLAQRHSYGGVKLSVSGLGASKLDLTGVHEVADNIPLLREMNLGDRMLLLAPIAAASLDFQNRSLEADKDPNGIARAVCDALNPASLNAALRGAFDAKDYFGGVAKPLVLAAIGEALGADIERQQAKGSKLEMVAFAIANVPQTGWLPPQLRAKGYDGPPVAKPAIAVAASDRKKRPARAATAKPAAKTPAKKRKAG